MLIHNQISCRFRLKGTSFTRYLLYMIIEPNFITHLMKTNKHSRIFTIKPPKKSNTNFVMCTSVSHVTVVTCSVPAVLPPNLSPLNSECPSGSTIDYNTTCAFACDTGYNTVDPTSVSCTESGALSPDLPACTGKAPFNFLLLINVLMFL